MTAWVSYFCEPCSNGKVNVIFMCESPNFECLAYFIVFKYQRAQDSMSVSEFPSGQTTTNPKKEFKVFNIPCAAINKLNCVLILTFPFWYKLTRNQTTPTIIEGIKRRCGYVCSLIYPAVEHEEYLLPYYYYYTEHSPKLHIHQQWYISCR